MIPKLKRNPKPNKKTSSGEDKAERLPKEEKSKVKTSGRHKLVSTFKSKLSPFTLGSPRSPEKQDKNPPMSAHDDSEWTISPRQSARSRASAPTLQGLIDAGQIATLAPSADTGDAVFLISQGIDEHDLRKACMALPRETPEDFARACALLDAALPLISSERHRQHLLKLFAPAMLQNFQSTLPAERWSTLCDAILPYVRETARVRLVEALSHKEKRIQLLRQQEKPKLGQGQALLRELHELLQEALVWHETELARTIVATAANVPALYEADWFRRKGRTEGEVLPRDLSGLHAEADALNGSWQKAMLSLWRAPAFHTLFDGPEKLLRVHGAGKDVRVSCHGPLDSSSVAAVAQVCECWMACGWSDEANALLKVVLGAVNDDTLLSELSGELSRRLLGIMDYEEAEPDSPEDPLAKVDEETLAKLVAQARELAQSQEVRTALGLPKEPIGAVTEILATEKVQSLRSIEELKRIEDTAALEEATDAQRIKAKQATAVHCIGLLAHIHQRTPLPSEQIEWMVDRLAAVLPEVRYDFDGMYRLHSAAERLRRAVETHARATPPSLQAQLTELAQASGDELGRLQRFDQRWTVRRDHHGVIQSLSYEPPPIQGDAKTLRAEDKAFKQRTRELHLEEDGPLREHLMPLNWVNAGDMDTADKELMAKQLAWYSERLSLWQRMDEQGGAQSYEIAMLNADIKRFLEDPLGPPWKTMQQTIVSAYSALGWSPRPTQWLSWSILALRQDTTAPFIKRMHQMAKSISSDLDVDEKTGQAKAMDLFVATLVDLMDQHTPWPIIQEALKQLDLGLQWPISDTDLARLSLAQAQRGDPEPLMRLLERKPSPDWPPSELLKLLKLLDHPSPAPAWIELRKLAAPLFQKAPDELSKAYRVLMGEPVQSPEQDPDLAINARRPALASHQLPAFSWINPEEFQVEPLRFPEKKPQ